MKFPGKRKSKHYFPVSDGARIPFDFQDEGNNSGISVVGIDQLIVDIEIDVEESFLTKYNILKGESQVLPTDLINEIYEEANSNNQIRGEFAGGAIGNTLHNYSVLSDDRSIALGSICSNIRVGDYAFKYICNTNSHVDFSYLKPCDGPMGRALCFITPDGERSFAIGKGIMNELCEEFIPHKVVASSACLLVSSFLLRDYSSNIYKATMKAIEIANDNDVPVIMAMGTSILVKEKRDEFLNLIKEKVNIVALNNEEARELVQEEDHLLAAEKILDLTDMVMLTRGDKGLYIGAYVCEDNKRSTKDRLHSKSIPEYNIYEYSRAQLKRFCKKPIKIYTHINPYLGGPTKIANTNGAGDAALAALMHDIASNKYHKLMVPNSPKHEVNYLSYSSIHQICKYANRVSYEILKVNSPRLSKGLPEKEDNLEEGYWTL